VPEEGVQAETIAARPPPPERSEGWEGAQAVGEGDRCGPGAVEALARESLLYVGLSDTGSHPPSAPVGPRFGGLAAGDGKSGAAHPGQIAVPSGQFSNPYLVVMEKAGKKGWKSRNLHKNPISCSAMAGPGIDANMQPNWGFHLWKLLHSILSGGHCK